MKQYLIIIFLLICIPLFAATNKTTNESVKLLVGPFFDSEDGITPETAINVTGLTIEIYREFDADTTPTRFANFVPTTSGGGLNDMVLITGSVSGMYSLEVTAAQLNFTGFSVLTIVDTDSVGIVGLPYWRNLNLTAANVVDAGYGTDYQQVDTIEIEGGDATDTINAVVDVVLDTVIPVSPTNNSINQRILAIDDLTQAAGNGDLASMDSKLDIIDTEIGDLVNFDPINDAVAVVTLVTTTTTNTDLVTAAAVKSAIETDGSKVDHLWEMTEDDSGTRRLTTNALEQAPSGSGTTAQQVWEYNISGISTTGYAGTSLNAARTNSSVISRDTGMSDFIFYPSEADWYIRIIRVRDYYIYDNNSGLMDASPTWGNSAIILVWDSEIEGYPVSLPTLDSSDYDILFYDNASPTSGDTTQYIERYISKYTHN